MSQPWRCHQKCVCFTALTHTGTEVRGIKGKHRLVCLKSSILEQHRHLNYGEVILSYFTDMNLWRHCREKLLQGIGAS
jgi:hypothetical protein